LISVGARAPAPFMEMDMKEEQDDLTLVYMFGYKNGKDSMKAENERLRAALQRIVDYGIVSSADLERALAVLEGVKSDD
jgi:hypothetical protein